MTRVKLENLYRDKKENLNLKFSVTSENRQKLVYLVSRKASSSELVKSGTKSATSIPESIQSDESETWNKSIGSRTNSNKVDGNDASQLNGSVTAENMAYDELDGEDAADEPGVGLKKTLISYIRRNNRIRLDSELD